MEYGLKKFKDFFLNNEKYWHVQWQQMFLLQKPLMQWIKGRTCHLEHVAIVAKPPPSANMVSIWQGTHSFTCVATSLDCHTWNKNYIYVKYANWARIGLL
jgi:hypothetical protein